MIEADSFLNSAVDAGFDFYTGVPCSFLTPIINRVISDQDLDYVGAASEGEAVAIAAGAWLAGRGTVVMCQNSGLGNAVNPLTSLSHPFQIPTLLIVTWRGGPGIEDEPQHQLMGPITPSMLDVMQVPYGNFPSSDNEISGAIAEAVAKIGSSNLPYAMIMQKGAVRDDGIETKPVEPPTQGIHSVLSISGDLPGRVSAMERLLEFVPNNAALIATTGFTGRELFTVSDRKQHLYQVGSMGCAAGMGLGVAVNSDKPVIVLDGDGAALMKLGTLGTVGAYAPKNLIHIVFDNGAYESTGGQPTVSPTVDFAAAALACGYPSAFTSDDLNGFETAVKKSLEQEGPHLIHMKVARGTIDGLGRPKITPPEVAQRFKAFLAED
ncbi:MAG: phosphonopyruvate decarboxylase [Rhodospirillaceae bacterium]|nr:phosphonopyruvate decarboxylase [Rhodospirillaceae bacterium]|tara:strand:+ start:3989 stop:5128 length:1140 start_codon:yes stop_codon:yes gene_type:complete